MDHIFSKTIPKYKYQFMNFFNISSLNSFVLKPFTHGEIGKLISQLYNQKALSPTSILVTILQNNIGVFVKPLILTLKQSFQ